MSIKEIETAVDYAYGLLNQKTKTTNCLTGEINIENKPVTKEDIASTKEVLRDVLGMLSSFKG